MSRCGNALKTVKCLTKYLIISYNYHTNTEINEADFLRICFKANNEICPQKPGMGMCLLTMGSPSVSHGEEKETEGLLEVTSSNFPPSPEISSVSLRGGGEVEMGEE